MVLRAREVDSFDKVNFAKDLLSAEESFDMVVVSDANVFLSETDVDSVGSKKLGRLTQLVKN